MAAPGAAQTLEECDVLVLGAGLSGLAAASVLGERAIVLERSERPGGLVRTECFDGYWFDRVIHLLYLPDRETERRVRAVLGGDLAPCPPEAWVETRAGVARYPFQMHLGGLDRQAVVRCLEDLARATFGPPQPSPANLEQMLEQTFGRAMCEVFFFPYNRKQWKRPLRELAPSGFTWNIARPEFERVVAGALDPETEFQAYNAQAHYPRPPLGCPVRGMELLSRRLAGRAHDLRLGHAVERIDPPRREVVVGQGGRRWRFRYRHACCCTLPLPAAVGMCESAPAELAEACRRLRRNRVLSIALSVRGPRPQGRGHRRYYADESISFTRLVYMHEFDPHLAPPEGWGLLAEVVEPAERPRERPDRVIERVIEDVRRVGALPPGSRLLDAHLMVIDPAYVVFSPQNIDVVADALAFLRSQEIEPIGRYGRWEYSSMGQVMRDAFRWADRMVQRMEGRDSRRRLEVPAVVGDRRVAR